jgi:hypothetical protein
MSAEQYCLEPHIRTASEPNGQDMHTESQPKRPPVCKQASLHSQAPICRPKGVRGRSRNGAPATACLIAAPINSAVPATPSGPRCWGDAVRAVNFGDVQRAPVGAALDVVGNDLEVELPLRGVINETGRDIHGRGRMTDCHRARAVFTGNKAANANALRAVSHRNNRLHSPRNGETESRE